MSVGFPATKDAVDRKAGALATQIRDTLTAIVGFKAWLDSQQDTDLAALGYAPEDITLLRDSYANLAALSAVAHAQQAVPAPNDFFFNAKHLYGIN